MDIQVREKVIQYIRSGNMEMAYLTVEADLSNNDPEALFIYAMFITHSSESAEEYDARCVKYLLKSASKEFPEAMYHLGIKYAIGEGVSQDKVRAAEFFRKAADLDVVAAKVSHGLNLYYGINGVEKDVASAVETMQAAAKEGEEAARHYLEKWGVDVT